MAQSQLVERTVLKALSDPATCTNETLLSIKSILSPSLTAKDGKNEKENVRGGLGHARAKSLVSTTKVTAKAAGKTKAHSRQLTVVEIKQDLFLSEQEKVNLAFQIINGCLKNLSQLAKEHLIAKREAVGAGVDAKPTPTSKVPPSDTALRSKSPNPRRIKAIDDVSKPTAKSASPPRTVASCACAALAHLQAYYRVSEGKDTAYQVENGTLAIIAKCIDLDLADLALDQLRCLKDRLSQHLGSKCEKGASRKQGMGVWVELMDLPENVADDRLLQFAVKIQQHVWQLVNSQNNAEAVEVLAGSRHVHCKLLSSSLLGVQDRLKAQKQITAMSRLLLQVSAIARLSADGVFRLRCSAFSLQISSATTLSSEEVKGICLKLARTIEAFARGSKASINERSKLMKDAVDPLLSSLGSHSSCAAELELVRKVLERASGSQKVNAAGGGGSPVETIQQAAVALNSETLSIDLQQTALALQRPLPDNKTARDRLLVEVVGLRRALHKAVSERKRPGGACFHVASGCITFMQGYLGLSTGSARPKDIQERLRVGRKFVKPFISTLIVCSLHHDSPTLDMFFHLRSCCGLFRQIMELDDTFADERFGDPAQPESSIFITISKLCHRIWSGKVSVHGSSDELAFEALVTGTHVMMPWTSEEKEAALYTQKLRYLMEAYMAREKWSEAHAIFAQLLNEHIANGTLDSLAAETTRNTPHKLHERGTSGGSLHKGLQHHTSILIKATGLKDSDVDLSTIGLNTAAHGLLLEWQYELLASYATQQRNTDKACVHSIEITQAKLLKLYDGQKYPIRRLRVGVAIADLLATLPQLCLPAELLDDVSISLKSKKYGEDAGLSIQATHLQANLEATLALLDPFGDDTPAILERSLQKYAATCSKVHSEQDIHEQIEDHKAWLDHLDGIADFYALRRDVGKEANVLETMLRVLICLPGAYDQRVKTLSRLSNAYCHMGHTAKALKVLDEAGGMVQSGNCSSSSQICWMLAKVEYSLAVLDYDGCRSLLKQSMQVATQGGDHSFIHRTFASSSPTLNVEDRRLVARAAYLNGAMNLRMGDAASALRFCTIAKCMLFKIWSSLEQIMPQDLPGPTRDSTNACPSSDDTSAMDDVQPVVVARSYAHLSAPQLRMLVPDLLQVAMLEMQIHDFRGSYHDAFAALKHANKIANYVGSGSACLSDIAAADLYIRSLPLNSASTREQKVEDARKRIDMADHDFLATAKVMDVLSFAKVSGDVLAAEEEPEEQLEILDGALKTLKSLLDEGVVEKLSFLSEARTSDLDALAGDMASMTIEKKTKTAKATKSKASSKTPAKKTAKASAQSEATKTAGATGADRPACVPLSAWHARLLCETSIAALQYHTEPDLDELAGLIESAGGLVQDASTAVDHSLASAGLLGHIANMQMAADITFNALHDSIVSVPPPQQQQKPEIEALAAKTPRKGKTTKVVAQPSTSIPACVSLLQTAFDDMRKSWASSSLSSSVARLQRHGRLLSSLSITASACSMAPSVEITHPLVVAYHSDLPAVRGRSLNRMIEHPSVDKLSKEDLRTWPSLDASLDASLDCGKALQLVDRSTFQRDFIDIIPASWNVVSMSLAEDLTAMHLIRYRNGQSPYALRIPFAHRESDDPDEEVLDMSVAYARLRSIIKQHEFASAEAGVTDQAGFKKKWWQKKHDLDTELRILLLDVEQQWFSGVKGIFSSQQFDRQALSNLQAELQSILSQHCLTKKGKGKAKSGVQTLKLEPRVLELFAGLGNPDNEIEIEGEDGFVNVSLGESAVLTDGIHDLVRLVLEGLQFAGESIAMDEVDIDNVIIKIVDALRDYHGSISDDHSTSRHTVLILDNQLHGFPWESIPCLRDQSVSRLPSLADLRDRILAARLDQSDCHLAGHHISRRSGTSLLNPSGDLKKTAQRFQPWLGKLPPNWAHLGKSPDDAGWREMLSENELFLYVGHGSTGQYVRPRVVKRLGYNEPNESTGSTCAVSWLIGCGSVAVEDLGEFEPSGMVLSYLAAGSPAVLGALWDVGDIDADHFSITAGDYWGLWDESNKGLDPKLFPARKKISEEKKAFGRIMSMTEAVARSRGGCKLPYLNGAAFVTYGIPVFLD